MTALFTAEKPPQRPLYRIEKERTDGSREFVAFVDERWVDAWRAAGCVATEVPQWPWEEDR